MITMFERRRAAAEHEFDIHDFLDVFIAGQCGWTFESDFIFKEIFVDCGGDAFRKASFTVHFQPNSDAVLSVSSVLMDTGDALGLRPRS